MRKNGAAVVVSRWSRCTPSVQASCSKRGDQRAADAGAPTIGKDEDGAEQTVGSFAFQTP